MSSRVRIREIHPAGVGPDELVGRHAFAGVSIGNPAYTASRLPRLLQWATARFATFQLVMGDDLHRHNWIGKAKGDAGKARALAVAESIPTHCLLRDVVSGYPGDRVRIVSSESIYGDPAFSRLCDTVTRHYHRSAEFCKVVSDDVEGFIRRRRRGVSPSRLAEVSPEQCVAYVLEELAIFSFLVSRGSTVQIYPGTNLSVLKRLSDRTLEAPTTDLSNQICVDLSMD